MNMDRSKTSAIPRRSLRRQYAPTLFTQLRSNQPRNLYSIRSPKPFIKRFKVRVKKLFNPNTIEQELTITKFGNSTAQSIPSIGVHKTKNVSIAKKESLVSSQSDAMPWLETDDNYMEMEILPEKQKKPADKWYVHCRDRKNFLPTNRVLSTLTHVPSCDIYSNTRPSKSNKEGYCYMLFGLGQTRTSIIAELCLKTFVWRKIQGTTNFGTPWIPEERAGHVASYLGNGKIFVYGGESNPKPSNKRRSHSKIIGKPKNSRRMVSGSENMLVYDVNSHIWTRFQPRISPGPRYLASLTRLTKKKGKHVLLLGGATVHVQKKKEDPLQKRRNAVQDISEVSAAKDLYLERTGEKVAGSIEEVDQKNEKFATEWRLTNDIWILNETTMKWFQPEISGELCPSMMGHSATESSIGSVFVIGGSRGLKKKKAKNNRKGALNDNDDDDDDDSHGSITNRSDNFFTIWELVTTSSPMHWTRIQSTGVNPSKRMLHTSVLSPWDNTTMYVFGGNLTDDNNLLLFDTSTSIWREGPQVGTRPAPRYGHSCVLTDNQPAGNTSRGNLSAAKHPILSSPLEQREVKMWLLGGTGRTGFEPLHIYEMAINPPACLLEERGRWQTKVRGHWSYQKQRLLSKPFRAWQVFVESRRRNHVLAEHDDVLAGCIPNKSSFKYTSTFNEMVKKQNNKKEVSITEIQSFRKSYPKFKRAATGPSLRNRVVHLSSHDVRVSREKQAAEKELEQKIYEENGKRQKNRELNGTLTERNHESSSASVWENIMSSVIVSTGTASSLINGRTSTHRPKSSPGSSRYTGSKNTRPTTAPARKYLKPVKTYLHVKSDSKLLPTKKN